MSDILHIEFAKDMPVAAVDVVAPDLRVVSRTMLSAGKSKDVDVPSERSFLRVHLPDGRAVTLDDPGNLNRIISRATLELATKGEALIADDYEMATSGNVDIESFGSDSRSASMGFGGGGGLASTEDDSLPQKPEPRTRGKAGESRKPATMPDATSDEPLQLKGGGEVRILGALDAIGRSRRGGGELQWKIAMPPTSHPFQLRYATENGGLITVALPASTLAVNIRRERTPNEGERLCVRLRTQGEHADAILSYMYRGDMYAAQALAEWAEEAEAMVLRDDSDPYSGLVGAYLLLRLRQFDRMRDWVRQIADRFDFLPDGCIIWAWQQLHMSRGGTTEARDYLLEACARGLPVYSEGLRLLLDGLCLLGKAGETEHERMMKLASNVVWTSPVMALREFDKRTSSRKPLAVEVTFAQ